MPKIAHTVFELMQKQHLWIEPMMDGHYALFSKTDLMPQPTVIGVHHSLNHARANLDAIITLFTPNITEGSVMDVSEWDKEEE